MTTQIAFRTALADNCSTIPEAGGRPQAIEKRRQSMIVKYEAGVELISSIALSEAYETSVLENKPENTEQLIVS